MSSDRSCSTCPSTWKKIGAFFIDFWGCFLIFGFAVAYFSGNLTNEGFSLEGAPALFSFFLIISYFVIMGRYFGGTFGKKIFGIVHHAKHQG